MSAPVDVRCVIATTIADLRASGDTGMVEHLLDADAALAKLFEVARTLSADLEHAIAIANVGSPDTVHVRHPIRVSLNQFDEALRPAGGAV